MTLIEMIRKAKENRMRWLAVDENGKVYGDDSKPTRIGACWDAWFYLGHYNLTCDWRDSLIDITKLKGIK